MTIITSLEAMAGSYYFPSGNFPVEESKSQRSQHLDVMKLRHMLVYLPQARFH